MQTHPNDDKEPSLYILMISVHGLIRANDMELGINADTGGQTKYVVELTKSLAQHPQVAKVDLLTRLIDDDAVDADYARAEEQFSENTRIIRLQAGPKKNIRKELLWKHLDQMVDKCLQFLRKQGQLPDFIHAYYAEFHIHNRTKTVLTKFLI